MEVFPMGDLILRLGGADPQATADALEAFCEKALGGGVRRSTAAPGGGPSTRTDPVAVAALVLSIPAAALSAINLAERIGAREKARELIALARRLAKSDGATVLADTPEGPRDLAAMSEDALLELVNREVARRDS